ncbi:MAG: SIMPL domain-containing protein [Pyrinomonadaceae bacterium]
MNGERNNYLYNGGIALAIGLVLSSVIFGWFYAKTKKSDEAIAVTGSAKKRIKSDLVVWSASVTYQAPKLADAYATLSANVPRVKEYLMSKGVPENQITISSITTATLRKQQNNYDSMSNVAMGNMATGGDSSAISGYSLQQSVEVRSTDVDKIAQIAREATELINQGILIESGAPQYSYTQLGDLKIEMLGEAAKDAKERAEKIAASTGNSIGAVRSARMGVMQITAADSTEVSDMGISDTSSIDKDVTAVVNISFAVD